MTPVSRILDFSAEHRGRCFNNKCRVELPGVTDVPSWCPKCKAENDAAEERRRAEKATEQAAERARQHELAIRDANEAFPSRYQWAAFGAPELAARVRDAAAFEQARADYGSKSDAPPGWAWDGARRVVLPSGGRVTALVVLQAARLVELMGRDT